MAYSLGENGTHEDWSYLASALSLDQWNALLNGKLSYNNPTLVYQVQQWALLYKNHCTNPDPVTSTTAQQVFSTGKAAMYVGGSWLIPTFGTLGANLGIMVTPYSKTPQHTIVEMPGGGYGVPSSSKNVALAASFLTFMLSQKGQQIITTSGQPPVVSRGIVMTNAAMKSLLGLADSGKYVQYPMYDNYVQPSVATGINNEMDLAFVSQASAAAALSNLEATQQALPASLRNINYGL
jgi:ABC-type glycerol-3-phosphate transport system substrate-binding protein